jgi:alpha-galactosidase
MRFLVPTTKIAIIGAGSVDFGLNSLATIIREERLRGSELALVDLNADSLQRVTRVAERMSDSWDAGMTIRADTDRTAVLDGAEFVIISVEVPPRETLWQMDWEIPLKHGLRQPYGENGGPGGLMHACRQIPPIMGIVRDMEQQCPQAWLINFSNPLPRITRAVSKYSQIKIVGKCHQIETGYALVAVLLRNHYGFEVPSGINLHSDPANVGRTRGLASAGRSRFTIKSAGLNHFIWLMDVRDNETGEDLYPVLRAAAAEAPPTLEPFSMALFRDFGYLPLPGDTHLVEYLPWAHDPISRPWEKYQIPLYAWGDHEMVRTILHQMLAELADGSQKVDSLRDAQSEGAAELIAAIVANEQYYDEAVNIPNRGAITNLPDETIVEIPGLVSGMGVNGINLGPLPSAVAELLRREAMLVEMVVETAVTGDRSLALQTLLLDPMINDIDRAKAILDDYLAAFEGYLPQFH